MHHAEAFCAGKLRPLTEQWHLHGARAGKGADGGAEQQQQMWVQSLGDRGRRWEGSPGNFCNGVPGGGAVRGFYRWCGSCKENSTGVRKPGSRSIPATNSLQLDSLRLSNKSGQIYFA